MGGEVAPRVKELTRLRAAEFSSQDSHGKEEADLLLL